MPTDANASLPSGFSTTSASTHLRQKATTHMESNISSEKRLWAVSKRLQDFSGQRTSSINCAKPQLQTSKTSSLVKTSTRRQTDKGSDPMCQSSNVEYCQSPQQESYLRPPQKKPIYNAHFQARNRTPSSRFNLSTNSFVTRNSLALNANASRHPKTIPEPIARRSHGFISSQKQKSHRKKTALQKR